MGIVNFQVSGSRIYDRLFDKSEEGPFEVPTGHKKFGVIIKPVPGDPKFYVFKDSNSACLFCLLAY